MKKILFLSALGLASLQMAQAQEGTFHASSPWSAGVNVSTLGFGAELGYKVNTAFILRGTFNYMTYSRKFNGANFDTSAKLRLMTLGLMADWHVMENGFRLTGGLLYNGNRLNLDAKAKGNFTINGRAYTAAQIETASGHIDFRKASPYVGVGYDSSYSNPGLGFVFEVGALFQGKLRGKVEKISGLLATQSQAINDAKDEIVKELNKSWLKVYPVIKLGVTYRF